MNLWSFILSHTEYWLIITNYLGLHKELNKLHMKDTRTAEVGASYCHRVIISRLKSDAGNRGAGFLNLTAGRKICLHDKWDSEQCDSALSHNSEQKHIHCICNVYKSELFRQFQLTQRCPTLGDSQLLKN